MRLTAGSWQAELLPALGGAVGALRHRNVDVLRPTPAGTSDPLGTASFPLVPYANRIADGRFEFEGQAITLPRNFGDHPHSLHGVGWQRQWSVRRQSEAEALLGLAHPGDADWPWPFDAEQHFALHDTGLSVTLTLRNVGEVAMPAGLGFHPYFPASAETRLQAQVEGAWLSDDTQLPTQRVGAGHFGGWSIGDGVARPALVDHCHDGWDGEARIDQGTYIVRLKASGTRWLHLYMPPGKAFFCAEPVSHLPDAVNHPGNGMAVLAPGEALTIEMRIEVS